MKDFQKTIEFSERGIAQDDKDEYIWSILGRSQFELGNYTKAKKALEKAIELDRTLCSAYEYMGHIYGKMDDRNKQIYYYKKTIEVHPAHGSAYLNLLKLGSISLAEEHQNELGGEALNSIAYELILMERFGEADELLNTGLKKAPDYSYLYATKGMNYLRQGKVQSGHELYLQAINISPEDVNLRKKFHYEYGRALRIDGQFEEAVQELERALQVESEYVTKAQIEIEIQKAQKGNITK